jgi:heptosyltransferase-2
MAQPLLSRLRSSGASIDVVAPPWVAPVLRRMPEVGEVIEADLRHGVLQLGERWRLGKMLKERGYESAYVLPNTWKAALIPLLAGIPMRRGSPNKGRTESMAAHYARLAPGNDVVGKLELKKTPNETAKKFGIAGDYAVLCPGAEYGPAKRWPYFKELAARLNLPVVLLGSASDLSSAESIPGKNLVGKTTLDEAIDLVAGARYVISNDSGLMHVAAALGTPQVALFGSSSPEHTPPRSQAARVVWLKPDCSPCFARECPLGHFRCMRELGVERVLQEIEFLRPEPR